MLCVSVVGFKLTNTCNSNLYPAGDFVWAAAEKSHSVEVHSSETARSLSPGVDVVCGPRRRLLCRYLLPPVTPEPTGELLLHPYSQSRIKEHQWMK